MLLIISSPVPRPLRGNESSAPAPGQRPSCATSTSVGLRRRRNQKSRVESLPSPFKSITALSVIVDISERVELAGDDARKESRVRWRRRGGPSDGPSSDGPPPPGASANGMVTSRRVRVAGAGIVVTVVVPLVALTSMRALLVTVIKC